MADDSTIRDKDIQIFDLEEVQQHVTEDDCWVVLGKDVFDITTFLDNHPGGADLILHDAGKDITDILRDENVHTHTANAYNILKEYKIGEIRIDNNNNGDIKDSPDINEMELVGFKEDLVDWNRGMVLQVHKFGRDYIKWVHTPVNRKIKMFDHVILDFFSTTNWVAIPLVWIPVVVIFALIGCQALASKLPSDESLTLTYLNLLLTMLFYFVAGLFMWTFVEYILHKYLFHMEPNGDSPFQITMHFFFHGLHHKVPFDEGRLVFPPTIASIFAVIYWYGLAANLPEGVNAMVFSGCVAGYICYDMIHYYIHHGNPTKGSYLYDMKHYHVKHHFVDSNEGFGISSKLWDAVFDAGKRKFL